jgi:hypothetical protein
VDWPHKTEGGALAGPDADRKLTIAGGGQLMDDTVTEAVVCTQWERLGVQVGLDVGWGHAGSIVCDGEMEMIGNDGEGDTDLPAASKGNRNSAGMLMPNGLSRVANEIDGNALDDLRGKAQGRKRNLAGDGDVCRAGGDAPKDRRKAE